MESRTIDLDGPVHHLFYDGPSDPPPFVLVHGLGGSHVNWRSIAPGLAERARTLVLDLAGFGRTPLAGREATVQANRVLLDRFIDRLAGRPVILVGNSMGGYISMAQAHLNPESVAGLVLVDPALARTRGQPIDRTVAAVFAAYMVPAVGERFVEARLRRWGPERLVRDTLSLCTVDPARVDPALVEASMELARERMQMPWVTEAFLQAARSLVRVLARRRRSFLEMVAQIAPPTLLLMGKQDRLVPVYAADAIARLRPDWDYVVIDDCGHVPMMEWPAETLAAIERWMDGPAAVMIAAAGARAHG